MSVVVSDASALIALQQIGQLTLLERLFGTLLIPPAVARETAAGGTLPTWIHERPLAQPLGIPIIGTLGVLFAAKRKGIITAVR
ncbi:MAG: hypothetical protein HY766_09110, partial [candidate division NC10 bacterium]|nr:hypothetical protein [candidate division NC10 bacterium]